MNELNEKELKRIEWIRTEVDNILWNKVLTLKLGKNVYDEIQKELDKVFEERISEIGG